jgi:hypothetical protein
VLAITTDNASNNDTFIKKLAEICQKDNFEFYGKDQHVRCCAHVLNISVQEGLAKLKSTAPDDENSVLLKGDVASVIPKVGL